MGDDFFSPAKDTVVSGTKVTWTWTGSTAHTVTFDDGPASGDPQISGTFSRTFDSTGTFQYHCLVHGAAMSGTVTVQ